MRERDNKGRFVKKDSEKVEKSKKGGSSRDNKEIIPKSKLLSWVNWVMIKK